MLTILSKNKQNSIKLLGKMLHAKADWQKNIVRDEGIEKNPSYRKSPPPPSKVKWSAP